MRKHVALAGLSLALVTAACQWLVGIEDRPAVSAPAEAGATPDGGDAGVDATPPDPCLATNVPPVPAVADDDTEQDLVFALSRIEFGIDGGLPYLVNLDKRCTCPAEESCKRPVGSTPACDGLQGSDNALAPVIGLLQSFKVVEQKTLNDNLLAGISGALIRVEKYNGKAEDPKVVVSVYGALGTETGKPKGTAEDRWRVDESALASPGTGSLVAKYRDTNAYVTGSRLVAFVNFAFDIGGDPRQPPLRADLRDGYIVADLDPSSRLTGVITGRWPTSSVLGDIQTFPDPLLGSGTLCGDSGTFKTVKQIVCGAADITSASGVDGLNRDCDALSVHVGFEATRASFGAVQARPDAGASSCGAGPAPSCL